MGSVMQNRVKGGHQILLGVALVNYKSKEKTKRSYLRNHIKMGNIQNSHKQKKGRIEMKTNLQKNFLY